MISVGEKTEAEPEKDILEAVGVLEDGWELHFVLSGHILTGNSVRLSHLLFHLDMNFVQYTNFVKTTIRKTVQSKDPRQDVHQKDYHPES